MANCFDLTDKQIKNVIDELGLTGTHHNDQYIAAYHIIQPEKVGCARYVQKIEERETDLNKRPKVQEPTKKEVDNSFRDECDSILCELEANDLSSLPKLTKKQCDTIKDIIFTGVNGCEQYFESVEDMKEVSPEYYHIYTLLDNVKPVRTRKVDKKKFVKNRLKKIGLATEVNSIISKAKPELLFDDEYNTFVLYNKKNSTLVIAKCDIDYTDRFKGAKTLLGNHTKYRVNAKFIPKIVSCRSVKSILSVLPIRKSTEASAVQLNSDTVLLKAFKG